MKRVILVLTALVTAMTVSVLATDTKALALTVIVMDPLALPLSCPCVKGYAQRDYEQLARYMEQQIGRPVELAFSESLTAALKKKTNGKADVVIGKHSVVLHDAKQTDLKFSPVASLTGKDGKTTQTGLIVVLKDDPAKTIADLKEYKILYGEEAAEEKHGAVMKMLKGNQFAIAPKPETCAACDEGATKLMDLGPQAKTACVISSYAKPLLEGCGTVPKGTLRVVAETEPVHFVVAFTNDGLSKDVKDAVSKCLMSVKDNADLLTAIESKNGFVKFEEPKKK
jgi:ABC-type phosphate/phosphonate transport system substrate-binding protein